MSGDKPSIVVTAFPATLEIGVPQERLATPLMCTVQAPQSCRPQPNFVPVNPSVSRNTHSSGIWGGTSTLCRFPFRVNSTAGIGILLKNSRQYTTGRVNDAKPNPSFERRGMGPQPHLNSNEIHVARLHFVVSSALV